MGWCTWVGHTEVANGETYLCRYLLSICGLQFEIHVITASKTKLNVSCWSLGRLAVSSFEADFPKTTSSLWRKNSQVS